MSPAADSPAHGPNGAAAQYPTGTHAIARRADSRWVAAGAEPKSEIQTCSST